MIKKTTILTVVTVFFMVNHVIAFSQSGRLSALNEFNVDKNRSILLRTNRCHGCYLAYAKLSGMDLSNADLSDANLIGATLMNATLYGADLSGAKIAGANFTGAQWIDGSICQTGSIGRCIRFTQ